MTDAPPPPEPSRWQRLARGFMRAFHAYAGWLVSISWWRFALLSLLLLIGASMLQSLPPFRWTIHETVSDAEPTTPPLPPLPPVPPLPKAPAVPPDTAASGAQAPASAASAPGKQLIHIDKRDGKRVEISIDEGGIRVRQTGPASAPVAPAAASEPAGEPVVEIKLPPGIATEGVREAVEEARRAIADAVQEARDEARQAERDAREAERAARGIEDKIVTIDHGGGPQTRIRTVRWGDFLTDLAALWIVASIAIKATYKGRIQAEVKAAQAVEAAEAESLKRQVAEARMAAMQAQVEPHFLFNTLASIDHLIEVDPPRASKMQRNLIALLRASMPTLREANGQGGPGGTRDLGRELAVIRPYLEILKVRMEERLDTEVDVPEGLLSAEFPPMMLQTLVENAIKHGLEPKAEGGRLTVKAEIVHGKLAVTVADTGLGFGQAPTAGTGVGLANIRERLQLLYGGKGALTITENPGGGTRVTVSVPYKPVEGAGA